VSSCDNFNPTMFVLSLARENKEILHYASSGSTPEYQRKYLSVVPVVLKSNRNETFSSVFRWTRKSGKSMELVRHSRKGHVVLFCFALRTTHRFQLLGVVAP
jgi:hypothetical protein